MCRVFIYNTQTQLHPNEYVYMCVCVQERSFRKCTHKLTFALVVIISSEYIHQYFPSTIPHVASGVGIFLLNFELLLSLEFSLCFVMWAQCFDRWTLVASININMRIHKLYRDGHGWRQYAIQLELIEDALPIRFDCFSCFENFQKFCHQLNLDDKFC